MKIVHTVCVYVLQPMLLLQQYEVYRHHATRNTSNCKSELAVLILYFGNICSVIIWNNSIAKEP